MRALAIVFTLCGCGDNFADPRDAHGGERLRLITYVYEDGTREWDREVFYDAARGEPCRPAKFSDGLRYCMPVAAAGQTVFVDAACSRSLGSEVPEVPPPTYFVRTFELGGVTLPSRLYRGGARVAAPPQIWEQIDDVCIGPSAPEQRWYYELTEEIRPSALVRIRESAQLEGERLAVGIDTSEDGLRVPGALYDRELGACTAVRRANAETTPCVPDELPAADYYADAACTEPAIALPAGMTADVAKHHARSSDCWSLRRVGAQLASPTLYVQLDGACVAVQPPSGLALYSDGGELPIASAERVPRAGAGNRMAPIDLVDGPVRAPDGFLTDATLGAECRRQQLGEEHVCVPHAQVTARVVFADPQCSTQLRLAFVPVGACHPPARFAADGDAIHPIGEPYPETFYELEPGDRCGTFAAPPGFVAHALAPALPPSAFARATVEIAD